MNKEKQEVIETALSALERLLRMFQIERYIYLVLTAISFVMLLYAAYLLIIERSCQDGVKSEFLVTIFGSAGLIAASSARISFFFNKAFNLIEALIRRNIK